MIELLTNPRWLLTYIYEGIYEPSNKLTIHSMGCLYISRRVCVCGSVCPSHLNRVSVIFRRSEIFLSMEFWKKKLKFEWISKFPLKLSTFYPITFRQCKQLKMFVNTGLLLRVSDSLEYLNLNGFPFLEMKI